MMRTDPTARMLGLAGLAMVLGGPALFLLGADDERPGALGELQRRRQTGR